MRQTQKNIFIIIMLFCKSIFFINADVSFAAENQVKIIVNKTNPIGELNVSELQRVFLKRKKYWDSNQELILPVNMSFNSKLRDIFTQRHLSRSVNAVKNHWQQMIFSGRDIPPPEFDSEAEVIEFVARNKNAIGYVASDTKTSEVKEIRLIEK